MPGVIMYIDGSQVQHKRHANESTKFVNGWSIIIHSEGQSQEVMGASEIRQSDIGSHEFFAFVECMKVAKEKGYEPKDISIYTDDEVMAYIDFNLHKDNYRRGFLMQVDKWKYLCKRYYTEETLDEVLEFVRQVRVNKVKGHAQCVDNLRCDYLAKYAAKSKLHGKAYNAKFLTMDEQLKKGFIFYDNSQTAQVWHPPFVKNVSDLLGVDEEIVAQQAALSEDVFGLSDTSEHHTPTFN